MKRREIDMKKKILFTRPLKLPVQAEDKLKKGEFDIILSPASTEKDLLPLVKDVHGIIAHGTGISGNIIQSAPLLQVIATPQVGFDKIDVAAATRAGIAVIANTGLSPGTVAEFTLGLMIALARRIVSSDYDLRQQKDWSVRGVYVNPSLQMGNDLHGTTVGLVGFGSIGSAVAQLCRGALSSRIMAYDPFVSQTMMAARGVEKRANLIDLAQESDFLSLHMALTDETTHIINETILRAMKPGAYLINCARGAVVDEKALVMALEKHWIAGAATDVFEEEPVNPGNPLLNMQNVIVTPHIAGVTLQSSNERGEEIVKRIIDIFAGKKPQGLVNPEVWTRYLRKTISGK
jgi:phosphoglycerate dehydrogenase-like enzyme